MHTGQGQEEVPNTQHVYRVMTAKGLCKFVLLLFALGVAGDSNSSTDAGKE